MKGVPLVFMVLLSIYITAGQYQSGENLVREVKDVLNYAMEIVRQRMRSEATMAEKMKCKFLFHFSCPRFLFKIQFPFSRFHYLSRGDSFLFNNND